MIITLINQVIQLFIVSFSISFCASVAWLMLFNRLYFSLQSRSNESALSRYITKYLKIVFLSLRYSLIASFSAPIVAIWLIHKACSNNPAFLPSMRSEAARDTSKAVANQVAKEVASEVAKDVIFGVAKEVVTQCVEATNEDKPDKVGGLVSNVFGSITDPSTQFKMGLHVGNQDTINIGVQVSGPLSKAILAITRLETGTTIQSKLC